MDSDNGEQLLFRPLNTMLSLLANTAKKTHILRLHNDDHLFGTVECHQHSLLLQSMHVNS